MRLVFHEYWVIQLTIDPAGTALKQWVLWGKKIWEDKGFKHGLNIAGDVFVETYYVIEAAHSI